MTFFTLIIFLVLGTACGLQTENSVSHDRERYSDPEPQSSGGNDTSGLSEVRAIMKARCSACHASFPTLSEKDWIGAGYVIPRAAVDSLLFKRLRGSGAGGKENMPPESALTQNEILTFYNWIQKMAQSARESGQSHSSSTRGTPNSRSLAWESNATPTVATSSQ